MATYEITAIPHGENTSFWRAGKRWSRTPTTVTLRTGELKAGEVLGASEITESDLQKLKADPQIKVSEGSGSAPASEVTTSAEEHEGSRRRR